MALVGKLEADVEIQAPAHLFHDVFSCRPHHVNIMSPDKIQGCDLHDGDWGKKGTVICWSYTHGKFLQLFLIINLQLVSCVYIYTYTHHYVLVKTELGMLINYTINQMGKLRLLRRLLRT